MLYSIRSLSNNAITIDTYLYEDDIACSAHQKSYLNSEFLVIFRAGNEVKMDYKLTLNLTAKGEVEVHAMYRVPSLRWRTTSELKCKKFI